MQSMAMQSYLIKKSLISPPVKAPRHVVKFFEQFKKLSPSGGEPNLVANKITEEGEAEECHSELSEDIALVMSNYLLLKNILSHFHSWQELKILSSVSVTWASVIRNLHSMDVAPRYFYYHTNSAPFVFKYNKEFIVEPSYVIMFVTKSGNKSKIKCSLFPDSPCDKECDDTHRLLDYLYARLCYPKNVMIAHECLKIAYSPPLVTLPENTKPNRRLKLPFNCERDECLSGVLLPKIPGVDIFSMKLSAKHETLEAQVQFAAKVIHMLDHRVVKSILIFRGTHDLSDDTMDVVTKVVNEQGEENPVAIGGCFIERSSMGEFNHAHSHRYVETIFTFFTVPKDPPAPVEFDAYSRVFTQNITVESDLVLEMKKMSDSIPRREHSAALKLSCIGRQPSVDKMEDRLFREHFPNTSLVGCYGQGEIGCDCLPPLPRQKRRPPNNDGDFMYTYSYSTVFVIYMWGKLL